MVRMFDIRLEELLQEGSDPAWIDRKLFETEMANLHRYGYGVKSFMLSMLETAVEISGATADASIIPIRTSPAVPVLIRSDQRTRSPVRPRT